MNKSMIYVILWGFLALQMSNTSFATLGCMEKSLRLKELGDPKEYHFVTGGDEGPCHCPCDYYKAQSKPLPYGQCPQCKHFFAEPSLIIVTEKIRKEAAQRATTNTSPVAFQNTDKIIDEWRKLNRARIGGG